MGESVKYVGKDIGGGDMKVSRQDSTGVKIGVNTEESGGDKLLFLLSDKMKNPFV